MVKKFVPLSIQLEHLTILVASLVCMLRCVRCMLPLLHGLRLHLHGLRFCALRSVPCELQMNTDSRTARTEIHSIVLGAFPRTFLEQHPLITLPVPVCFTTHSPPMATGMRLYLPGRPPVALPEFLRSFPLFLHCP